MSSRGIRCDSYVIPCAVVLAAVLFLPSVSAAQTPKASPAVDPVSQVEKKYPGLMAELGHLLDRLKHEVQFPAPRNQSNLLPRLPASTTFYAAFPNYGEVTHQALTVFNDELTRSAVLRDWWQQNDMAKTGPQIGSFIEKFYALSQYLGEEWVIAGGTEGTAPSGVFFTEVRKPGLKDFLQQMAKEVPVTAHGDFRIVDAHELASADIPKKPGQLIVLVRSDFVVVGSDADALRSFNKSLDARTNEFASTSFGQRAAKAYEGGASAVAAADLHKILSHIPAGKPADPHALEASGFKDVKYLVWDHKNFAGQPVGEMELSFVAPRHGAAAWLAPPAPHHSLGFVSPRSAFVVSVLLKNLGEIFDDIKDLSASNPKAFGTLPQMEQAMHISLRDDLLSQLQGEITVAVDDLAATPPRWKVILRVNDAERLQKTLEKLLQSAPVVARQSEEAGVVYHSLAVPSAQKPMQIDYAFADGYLVVASNHESAREAVRLHQSGESLAGSTALLASLPPGYPRQVSAMVYEDAQAMTSSRLQQLSPEMAEAMAHLNGGPTPVVFCAYGEERAIRGVSAGAGADAAGILFGAAIAVPNLLRARGAANESAAIATLRSLNVAQTKYSYKYLQYGYARDLATLGPDPRDGELKTANHAGLIDADLGKANCTAGTWCEKAGYRFSIMSTCQMRSCKEFVAVATPVSLGGGARSFCSTSDGVIRFQAGSALMSPVSAFECKQWPPVQ
jgi:hypothetical protein